MMCYLETSTVVCYLSTYLDVNDVTHTTTIEMRHQPFVFSETFKGLEGCERFRPRSVNSARFFARPDGHNLLVLFRSG